LPRPQCDVDECCLFFLFSIFASVDSINGVTRTIFWPGSGPYFWPRFGAFPSHLTHLSVISADSHTHILAGGQNRKHKLAACFWSE
jgi:hypothetical protein